MILFEVANITHFSGERWNESVLSDLECMWSESNPHLVSVVRRLLEGSDEPFEAEESYIVDGRDWRKAYGKPYITVHVFKNLSCSF